MERSTTLKCNIPVGAEGELAKRTHYYQGMIDMALLGKGKDATYDQLNTSFIIFICTFDLFGKGLPMYTFRHRCVEKENVMKATGLPEKEVNILITSFS